MTGEDILHRIGDPYGERYLSTRQLTAWPDLTNPLHVALLLTDFDTELCMNGILGFLENSTGAYLNQTIDAFRLIGAEQTSIILTQIREAMHSHSVSHQALRSDFHGASEFQITSFSQLHLGRDDFTDAVDPLAKALYIYGQSRESPFSLPKPTLNDIQMTCSPNSNQPSPNHALRRTALGVTLAAADPPAACAHPASGHLSAHAATLSAVAELGAVRRCYAFSTL